jgi:hypothetical protein
MSSVGYGDINASEDSLEQGLAIFWMICGTGIQSICIGYFFYYIQMIESANQETSDKMQALKGHRDQYYIKPNLFYRVHRHIERNAL